MAIAINPTHVPGIAAAHGDGSSISVRSGNGRPPAATPGTLIGIGAEAPGAPPSTRSGSGVVALRTTARRAGSKYENASAGISSVPEVCGTTTNSHVREPTMPSGLTSRLLFTCGG